MPPTKGLIAIQLLGKGRPPQLVRRKDIDVWHTPLGDRYSYRNVALAVLGNERTVRKCLKKLLANAKIIASEIGITPEHYLARYHPLWHKRLSDALALFQRRKR